MGFVAIFLASLAGGFLFPWWWPVLPAYAAGFLIARRGFGAFLSGFAGTGAAWLLLAAFLDWRNHGLLSGRMAQMFHLPAPAFLLALTGLLGGVLGGLAAWAGQALRASLVGPKWAKQPAA